MNVDKRFRVKPSMKNYIKKASGLLGLSLCVLGCSGSFALSLEEAFQAAQNYVPALNAQRNQILAAQAQERIASSGLNPQVSLQASHTLGRYDNRTTRLAGETDYYDNESYRADLVVRQRIFDFNATRHLVAEAGFESAVQEYELQLLRDSVAINVVSAYIDVLRFQELSQVAEESVERGTELAYVIGEQVDSGRNALVERHLADSQMAFIQAQREFYQGLKEQAEASFFELTGLYPRDLEMIPHPAGSDSIRGFSDADLNQILLGSAAVAKAESELAAANASYSSANKANLPRLDLEFFAGTGKNEEASVGLDDSYGMNFILEWDLYSGGGIRANKQQNVALMESARENVAETYRIARAAVKGSLARIDTTMAREEFALAEEVANLLVYQTYQTQLVAGRRAPLDVFVVLNNYHQSTYELIDLKYQKILEEYQLLFDLGDLNNFLGRVR